MTSAAADWTGERTLVDPQTTQTLADHIIRTRPPNIAQLVQNAVPKLIQTFLPDGHANQSAKPIYRALTEAIIYDSDIGDNDLDALDTLCEAILHSGAHPVDQEHVMSVLNDAWSQRESVNHLDWIPGAIDMLIDCGLGKNADVPSLLSTVVNSTQAWSRRVAVEQWSLIDLLASDLNLTGLIDGIRPQEAEPEADQNDNRQAFAGKSIAIYSITERIAKRARQLIEQSFDGITFHLCHDKACTDRLKSLAKSADIFLVNTWDAKHAATNGIHDNRPKKSITLQPKSKSPASLFRTLEAEHGA